MKWLQADRGPRKAIPANAEPANSPILEMAMPVEFLTLTLHRSVPALAGVMLHLHHALGSVCAAECGVEVANVLEGGVRRAARVLAHLVPVVHHAFQLVRSTECRRLTYATQ